MYQIDEYERKQARLGALLTSLINADESGSWPAVWRLDERYSDLLNAFSSVVRGERERERLISIHCTLGPTYSPVHDEYHEVTAELLVDVASGFAQIKTFLNTLAVFINTSLPQSDTCSLRFKGWGSLVESAAKTSNSQVPLRDLRRLLAERGLDYQARFLEYRNKHLEHPSDLTARSLRHGPTKIMHTEGLAIRRHRGSSPSNTPPYVIDEVALQLFAGGRGHYFHVADSSTGEGTAKRGDLLGHIRDSSEEHFSVWGSHYHAFMTPDAPADLSLEVLKGSHEVLVSRESPDIFDAMGDLLEMTEAVIRTVAKSRLSS